MAALNQGYRLLTAFAESQALAKAGRKVSVRDEPCLFAPEAVEETLLVAVRRQEVAPRSAHKVV